MQSEALSKQESDKKRPASPPAQQQKRAKHKNDCPRLADKAHLSSKEETQESFEKCLKRAEGARGDKVSDVRVVLLCCVVLCVSEDSVNASPHTAKRNHQ